MRLYYFAGQWQLPGQQDRKAERVEIPTDSAGLCTWLNNRDRCEDAPQEPVNCPPASETASLVSRGPESYTDRSCRFEDEFEKLPLAMQLHFAALAMENARAAL